MGVNNLNLKRYVIYSIFGYVFLMVGIAVDIWASHQIDYNMMLAVVEATVGTIMILIGLHFISTSIEYKVYHELDCGKNEKLWVDYISEWLKL